MKRTYKINQILFSCLHSTITRFSGIPISHRSSVTLQLERVVYTEISGNRFSHKTNKSFFYKYTVGNNIVDVSRSDVGTSCCMKLTILSKFVYSIKIRCTISVPLATQDGNTQARLILRQCMQSLIFS